MIKLAALLRGINSGKSPTIKMDLLRQVFTDLGFKNVSSVIASGNIIFECEAADFKDRAALEVRIEAAILHYLGFQSTTILRSREELQEIINEDPFHGQKIDKQHRAHVTFVKDIKGTEQALDLPPTGVGYSILSAKNGAIFSLVDPTGKTPDLLTFVEKRFNKLVTTRSWGTVNKIVAKM